MIPPSTIDRDQMWAANTAAPFSITTVNKNVMQKDRCVRFIHPENTASPSSPKSFPQRVSGVRRNITSNTWQKPAKKFVIEQTQHLFYGRKRYSKTHRGRQMDDGHPAIRSFSSASGLVDWRWFCAQ